ncbi:FBOX domain-containing protein [Naegleria gruberi]|uniref:FBOX domain-containing protein n=1 Tax=Naegleria gruberi TaxID=5762 RepID=D2V4G4_NAEGR|nr:FBOX domain-containing protein [Naegleria gruberi]EFC48510.1 FBOX domain-containing protein [Naegleria gruberi]|eukprot:XP_002681254.1 FBOX domain-containing protein [Naegleria gruberi strain NEG-M]
MAGEEQGISRRKKWFYFFQYFFLFILFAHGIRSGFFTLLNRSQYKSGATNTMCSQATPESVREKLIRTGHKSSETDALISTKSLNVFTSSEFSNLKKEHHLCDYPSELQFTKVIWLFTDGLPVKYSKKTFDHFKDHMVLYTIDVPGPKYSHAIYTSYMTGQLPTNYQGNPIEGDSLVKSIQRSPDMGPLTYVGPEWSFLAIHGNKHYDKLFKRIELKEEPLDQPHDQGYRFFFANEDARKFYRETLDTIKGEGGSLFAHSAIFDHINHGVFRHDPTNLDYLTYLSDRIASDINPLKDWIDANPDYLLILSSDHGTDDVSNGYVLHGYSRDGNEGYVMLYNPRLKPYDERLDIVDVCPTVAKYLKGVDIPADNIGVSRAYFGDDEESLKYKSYVLKESLVQLTDTTTRRGTDLLRSASSILNLLKMEASDMSFSEKFKSIRDFNTELSKLNVEMKQKLYQLMDTPVFWVAFYVACTLVMVVIGLYRFNFHAIHLLAENVRETAPQEQKALYVQYYTIAGFHIYYLGFIIMAFLYFVFVLLFNPKRLDRLIIPSLLYAFALMRDTPFGRVVTLLQNVQYFYLLVPAYILINKYCCQVKKKDKGFNSSGSSPQFEDDETKHHFFDILQLTISLFFMNHFMYGFHIGKEERLDVDAHPMAGAVGTYRALTDTSEMKPIVCTHCRQAVFYNILDTVLIGFDNLILHEFLEDVVRYIARMDITKETKETKETKPSTQNTSKERKNTEGFAFKFTSPERFDTSGLPASKPKKNSSSSKVFNPVTTTELHDDDESIDDLPSLIDVPPTTDKSFIVNDKIFGSFMRDTLFLIAEYLPYRDALSCRLVCKDWYSLDTYEIFWKTIYHQYIISNIIEKYQKMKDYSATTSATNNIPLSEILNDSKHYNREKKKQTVKLIQGINSNSGQKKLVPFVVHRAVMQSLLNAYEKHILEDGTAERGSIKEKLFSLQQNGDRRFKYLMEKQINSEMTIALNVFFGGLKTNFQYHSKEIVLNFLMHVLGEEYIRNISVMKFIPNVDFKLVLKKLFRGISQSEEYPKYWEIMIGLSLQNLPDLIPKKECSNVLKGLFESSKFKAQISWISIMFSNCYYYEDVNELMYELLNRNGIDTSDTLSISEYFTGSISKTFSLLSEYTFFIKYLQFLGKFLEGEKIYVQVTESSYFYSLIGRLSNEESTSLNDFLDNLPIPLLEMIKLRGINQFNVNELRLLEYVKGKGILYSQSAIENYLARFYIYSTQYGQVIKFLIDNYHADIYEIEKKVKFFPKLVQYLSNIYNNVGVYVTEFATLFSDKPIDLDKLTECSIGDLILKNWKNPTEFVQFCKKRFIQNIFYLPTVCRILSQAILEYYDNKLELKRAIYEAAMFNENLTLSNYVSQLLEEEPELLQETTLQFNNYPQTDPKFAISVYLFCNEK